MKKKGSKSSLCGLIRITCEGPEGKLIHLEGSEQYPIVSQLLCEFKI